MAKQKQGASVGRPSVRVANAGREEFYETPRGFFASRGRYESKSAK